MFRSPNPYSKKNPLRAHAFPLSGITPLDLLRRLRTEKMPVFFDSAGGNQEIAEYSYLSWSPFATLHCDQARSVFTQENGLAFPFPDHPLDALEALLASFEISKEGIPFPFAGGLMGYASYELGRWIEKLPPLPKDDLEFGDLWFGCFDFVIALNHKTGECNALICEWENDVDKRGNSYLKRRLAEIERVAQRPIPESSFQVLAPLQSDHSRDSYCRAVEKAKEYIYAGDIYQVNLSQRFDVPASGDALALYLRLRESNPAPFAAFLSTPQGAVLSSSPELFLRRRGEEIETRPIKGTRARSGKPELDEAVRAQLLASEKDRAELTMIIDLERNDLKRVCQTASVQVPRLFAVEEYETVFHLVSTVHGKLRPDIKISEILKATFPGGSITGAPKIRSMEIIAELEHSARSVYTGSIGWLGFDGNADFNIAIRSLLQKGNRVSYRVGGGIVADSNPQAEYEETLDKGAGMARALGFER